MRGFVESYGMQLAPHGKTTMAPKLRARQLAAGAWGITLATAHQTAAAHAHGVRRVLMANQLVGRRNMEIVADLLRDPGFEFFCPVDSPALVDQLGAFFRARGQTLQVLLELGVAGGRTGVRDAAQQEAAGRAGALPQALSLAGVELYEGVLEEADIRAFLQRAVAVTRELLAAGRFGRSPAVLSGAGSAGMTWWPRNSPPPAPATRWTSCCARCYLTHDVGVYRAAQERIRRPTRWPAACRKGCSRHCRSGPTCSRCPSRISPSSAWQARCRLRRRHADPRTALSSGTAAPVEAPSHWAVTGMMDQHAYLRLQPGDDLRVGDMIAFDISHPLPDLRQVAAYPGTGRPLACGRRRADLLLNGLAAGSPEESL